MPVHELTDRFCQTAKPRTDRQIDYFDTIVTGLTLRVSPAGTKTWNLHYTRSGDGKRARMKIGGYPELPLGKARQKAREARGTVGEGGDPLAERKARAAAQTVADMVESYIARHAAAKRSGKAIARRLRKNVLAIIGGVKLAELHRRDLTRCIDLIKDRGAATEANRVYEDLRAMVRWARGRGDLDENLTEGMRRPTETKPRSRVLSEAEIAIMWAALPKAVMREATRRVLRLCLVTGQRVGEVAGMTRAELDIENAVWTIPGARSKNGRPHAVPLTGMALAIIREQLADVAANDLRHRRETPTKFVFPGPGAHAAMRAHAVPKAVKKAEQPGKGKAGPTVMGIQSWRPHDLRRTVATMLQVLGVSPFLVGHVLGHLSVTKATVTTSVYATYSYDKEKREALDLWADRLSAIVAGDAAASVVPLRKAAVA